MTWTKSEIQHKLRTSDRWLIRGLLAIYARQTQDEQITQATRYKNYRGFNQADARLLSSYAQQIIAGGRPNHQQLYWARRKMNKYCSQLARIANTKDIATRPMVTVA